MNKTAFLVDSSAGINEKEIKKYKDSFFIPISITDENGEVYKDSIYTLSNEKFENLMKNNTLKTSAINAGEIKGFVDKLLENYDRVIFLGIGKKLSGQHSVIKPLEKDKELENKFFVFDTDGVSGILRKMFIKVHNHINQGGAIEEVQEIINKVKTQYKCLIIPKDINYLKRGGRMNAAAAAIATLIKIIPILSFNGEIDASSKCRTLKKAFRISLEVMQKEQENHEVEIYTSIVDEDLLQDLKDIIKELNIKIIGEYHLANVLSVHTGPNTFGMIMWKKEV
ncbi:DegV family protein [Spiroplasma endosymbiont of Amphibalanus improvisus]|uniref:DegV family protein n=1 Tax=Spiroplasma endosymbiont of Amphibalanus improvisus TaxID=3066327 RepID=UPI00313D2825